MLLANTFSLKGIEKKILVPCVSKKRTGSNPVFSKALFFFIPHVLVSGFASAFIKYGYRLPFNFSGSWGYCSLGFSMERIPPQEGNQHMMTGWAFFDVLLL